MTRVRFAPSPTGLLHVGNIRTALVNWLFAKTHGGQFILRLDDTDAARSTPEFAAAIEEDLRWLGLTWNEQAKQSERFARYADAKESLLASGRLYPCFETAEELEIRRKFQASRGMPPVYDRAGLKLSDAEKKKYLSEGRTPHYRFLLNDAEVKWHDLVRDEVKFAAGHLSDPVLLRADGVPTYTLASVVDDAEMAITHILRGEDHVSNTAVQVQLFEALGAAVPAFGHLALLKTREGGLSKREGGGDVRGLREGGIVPMAICSLLARIGTSDAVEPCASLDALAASFDISRFGRAPATYDEEELLRLNARLIAEMSYEEAAGLLPSCSPLLPPPARGGSVPLSPPVPLPPPRAGGDKGGGISPAFWNAMRANFTTLRDAEIWWNILYGDFAPVVEDAELLTKAAETLPQEWNKDAWKRWLSELSAATGKKGKALYHPLRLALTGREDGPDLAALLELMGREKAGQRLGRVG